MPAGYSLPAPEQGNTYEDIRDGFEWTIPETFNLASVVTDADAGATALVHVDEDGRSHEFTYGELAAAASALGARLREAGIGDGDRVGVCFPQSPECLIAHLAVYRVGGVVVPLSVLLGGESFSYTLAHSGARALLADAAAGERFADEIDESALDVEHVVELDGDNYAGERRHLGAFRGVASPDAAVDVAETAPDDAALVVYTSGTTGKPKGVAQGHQYLYGSLPGYQCWFHLFGDTHRERVWTPSEWAWAGALFDVVFPTLELGGTVVSRVRRSGFDPAAALSLIETERITRAFLPPTAVWQLRERADPSAYDLDSLEIVMCGGESLSATLFEWAEDALGVVVNESYGQTEANVLVGNCQTIFEARPGSMGRPYPGHDVQVVDDDGEPVTPGEVGEIALRAPDPVLFEGYWEDEAATEAVFDGDWYLTGDLATRDEDGYLQFRGRADDLIVTAGYRVNPTEVESALRESPAVSAAVVGGMPDEERGQVVAAAVVPEDPGAADDELADELRERVADAVGRHKVPRRIEFVRDPPETRTGKLDRSALFPGS